MSGCPVETAYFDFQIIHPEFVRVSGQIWVGFSRSGTDVRMVYTAGVVYSNDWPTNHEEIIFPEAQGIIPRIDTKQAKDIFFGNRAAQYKIKPIHTVLQGGEENKNLKKYVTQKLTASKGHGTRPKDQGPWTKVHGSRTMDHGPWTKDKGPMTKDQGPWTKDHGPRTTVHGPRDLVLARMGILEGTRA